MNNIPEQKEESKQQHRNSGETKDDTPHSTYLPNYDSNNNRWRDGPRLHPNNNDEPPSSPERHSHQRFGVYTETDDEALRRFRRIDQENFPPMEVVEREQHMGMMIPSGMSDDDIARAAEEQRIREAAATAAQEEEWRAEALAERLNNPLNAGGHGLEPIEDLYGSDSDSDIEGGGRRPIKKRKNKTKKKAKIKKMKPKTKIKKKTNKRKNKNIKKRKKRKTKRR